MHSYMSCKYPNGHYECTHSKHTHNSTDTNILLTSIVRIVMHMKYGTSFTHIQAFTKYRNITLFLSTFYTQLIAIFLSLHALIAPSLHYVYINLSIFIPLTASD